MKIITHIFFSFLLIIILTNCSSSPPLSLPTLTISLNAHSYLNSDNSKNSYPVLITFYQLNEPTLFENADYFSLLDKADKILSGSLIRKHEVEVRPNEELKKEISLSPEANYVGIFAAFRDIEKSHWKEIIDLGKEPIDNFIFSLQNFILKREL